MPMFARSLARGVLQVGCLLLALSGPGTLLTFADSDDSPSRVATYTLTDLGPGGATAINNHGQVVGGSGPGELGVFDALGSGHAFVWQAGQRRDLGALPGHTVSRALAINDHGLIAGGSSPDGGRPDEHAVLWQAGQVQDIGTGRASRATGLNDAGQVAGWVSASPEDFAVTWKAGQISNLNIFGGNFSHSTYAFGINNHARIVGEGSGEAFAWQAGVVHDLGPGSARAINNHDQIVGQSLGQAVQWQNGQRKMLGSLPGGTSSAALAISDHHQVVGWSDTATGRHHAVVWVGGRARDLNDLVRAARGWELTVATGINDDGQIVGSGLLHGAPHAILLRRADRDREGHDDHGRSGEDDESD